MTTALKRSDLLDLHVVEGLVTLLSQHASTHPRLFEVLAVNLQERGYRLVAEQKGVSGTYIRVEKVQD